MAEPKLNTRYQCCRTGLITFEESLQGALMVKIPFESLDADPIAGTYSTCIGQKDGTMQELTIKNLMETFKVENLVDLLTLEVPDQPTHEFDLSDWQAGKYPGFKWLNPPREAQDPSKVEEKWGAKLALFSANKPAPSTPKSAAKPTAKPAAEKPVEKPAEKALPKRALPTKSAKPAEARKETMESVLTALAKKNGVNEDDADAMQKLGNDYFFPAQDKLFGKDVSAETPEQWGQVAEELGL